MTSPLAVPEVGVHRRDGQRLLQRRVRHQQPLEAGVLVHGQDVPRLQADPAAGQSGRNNGNGPIQEEYLYTYAGLCVKTYVRVCVREFEWVKDIDYRT